MSLLFIVASRSSERLTRKKVRVRRTSRSGLLRRVTIPALYPTVNF